MKSSTRFADSIHDEHELLELQLKIARRADELAATLCSSHDDIDDWFCWVEAEREIIAAALDKAPPAPRSTSSARSWWAFDCCSVC